MKCPSGFVFQQTRATRPTQNDCRRSTKCRTCGGSWRSPQRSSAAARTCLPVSHYTASAPSATGRRRQVVTLRVSGSVLACFLYKIYGIFRRCMYYIYNRKMVCSGAVTNTTCYNCYKSPSAVVQQILYYRNARLLRSYSVFFIFVFFFYKLSF